jgi:hypothetical protein
MQYRWLSAFLIMPLLMALGGYLLRDQGHILQEKGMLLSVEQVIAQVGQDMGVTSWQPINLQVVLAKREALWSYRVSWQQDEYKNESYVYLLDARHGTILMHQRY